MNAILDTLVPAGTIGITGKPASGIVALPRN